MVVTMFKDGWSVRTISKMVKLHRVQVHRVKNDSKKLEDWRDRKSSERKPQRTARTSALERPSMTNFTQILQEASENWLGGTK